MYKKAKPFFLICETPLHAGSGSDLGIVDLPIQRERQTGYPKVEASGLKGSIRKSFETAGKGKDDFAHKEIDLCFGPEGNDLYSAALGFTDARVMLFPVKSMKGVYAYVTCRDVLNRFKGELKLCDIDDFPKIPDENTVTLNSGLIISSKNNDKKVVLEEYTYDVILSRECSEMAKWLSDNVVPRNDVNSFRRGRISTNLIVLSDDDFRDFVTMSTEVITRTRIDNDTGTVAPGALFTEEYLPSETILYSLVLASPIFNEYKGRFKMNGNRSEEELVMGFFEEYLPEAIQLGGNATIGKGLITTHIWR